MIFWILALCLAFVLGALLGRAQRDGRKAEKENRAKREATLVKSEMSEFLNYDGSEK